MMNWPSLAAVCEFGFDAFEGLIKETFDFIVVKSIIEMKITK